MGKCRTKGLDDISSNEETVDRELLERQLFCGEDQPSYRKILLWFKVRVDD